MSILHKFKENEPLQRAIKTTYKHMNESEMSMSSIVVAYYLLLSLFPLLITIGNLLPYLNLDSTEAIKYIKEIVPPDIYERLGGAITALLTQRSGGLLSISALATLWAASQGISALQTAMNKAYALTVKQNLIANRLIGLFVLILLCLVAVVGVVLLGFGQTILLFLQPILKISDTFIEKAQTLTFPVSIIGVLLVMCLLYYAVPNVIIKKKRFIFPGACFATIGSLLLSQVFGIYAKYFATRVAGYQVIGSVIVLMLWLVFAAKILILGSIINSVVQELVTGEEARSRDKAVHRFVKKKVENIRKNEEEK
ncbi:MAG: YihY/virulence factor BrkB family protein [Lactobacillales bacterium]|nr:YihY/virulence factor BrkB family protein [Lactobacillales bacterium]